MNKACIILNFEFEIWMFGQNLRLKRETETDEILNFKFKFDFF